MKNPRPHLLFVCGRNQWRSPTAERLYGDDPRITVRSAGVSASSRHRISLEDVRWADLIVVMENEHRSRIREMFRDAFVDIPPIECLEIPDEYGFMDAELCDLIRESVEALLGSD